MAYVNAACRVRATIVGKIHPLTQPACSCVDLTLINCSSIFRLTRAITLKKSAVPYMAYRKSGCQVRIMGKDKNLLLPPEPLFKLKSGLPKERNGNSV